MDTHLAYDPAAAPAQTPCRRRYFLHGLLPQLIIFEACIRRGSVTEAARELHIAQPTASCLVRKLSVTFGGRLMLRRYGRIEATPLGEKVLLLGAQIIDVLEQFDARERASSHRATEPLAVPPLEAMGFGRDARAPERNAQDSARL